MIYTGSTTKMINYSSDPQTVPVTLETELGRIIVTVNADECIKNDAYKVYSNLYIPAIEEPKKNYIQKLGLPSYMHYSGPLATDGQLTQVSVVLLEAGTDEVIKTFYTDYMTLK